MSHIDVCNHVDHWLTFVLSIYLKKFEIYRIFYICFTVNFVESFAFGSLISAVDPVATVAIFHAIDVDPVLNMLVFGESILNGNY